MEVEGWWLLQRCNDCKPFWSRVEIPTQKQIFFSLIFVRIHTKIVIQIVYCEFVHGVCYTNCILRIRTRCGFCTNSYIFLYELYSTYSYNEPHIPIRMLQFNLLYNGIFCVAKTSPPAPTRPRPAAPTN